jgi:two-component system chemotaxis response regulator CheY
MARRAMVIDDSRAMRGILRRMLVEAGLEVIEAANGREALDRLHAGETIDVALVDWNMPEMNGLEFVMAVRADPRFADLRLMMVTTETEMHQVVRALEAGANEYVMKPFTVDVVRDKLALLGVGEPMS